MSTSNEFLLVASDDSFELNNGKLLAIESTDKIKTLPGMIFTRGLMIK